MPVVAGRSRTVCNSIPVHSFWALASILYAIADSAAVGRSLDFSSFGPREPSMNSVLDLGVHALRASYSSGTLTCRAAIEEVLARISAAGDDKVWISRAKDADLLAAADALDARRGEIKGLPLYGVPFAVKDNIDVAGLPTTAACPGFAYTPTKSAEVVRRLVEAGAIAIGKTNLDQFATGLVGVRSPYGVPRNPFNPDYIPGGSRPAEARSSRRSATSGCGS